MYIYICKLTEKIILPSDERCNDRVGLAATPQKGDLIEFAAHRLIHRASLVQSWDACW